MKKIVFHIISLAIPFTITAQKPAMLSGGLNLLAGWATNSKNATILPSIHVFPAIKFVQRGDFTVLAGIPLSAGFSIQDDEENKPITYAGLDLPVTLNFLFGAGFNNQSKAKSGFMIGGGIGYHVSQNKIYLSNEIEKHHLRFTGFMINSGLTFPFKTGDQTGGVMIRCSWLASYPDFDKNVVGLGLVFW